MMKLAAWSAVVLLTLELVLQAIAYNVWSRQRSGEVRPEGDGPVVMCVGDSMTYGMGSTGEAGTYPRQLQRILRERDPRPWVVINCAWPGRDSRTVLKYLPQQLRRFRPDYVCVLAGINDQWTRAVKVDDLDLEDSFPIVWRTRRFLDIMLVGRLDRYEESPLVGSWNKNGVEFRFESDGKLFCDEQQLRWSLSGGDLVVVDQDGVRQSADWEIKGGQLHLSSGMWKREFVLDPGRATPQSPADAGWRAVALGDLDAAAAAFQQVLTDADAPIRDLARAREGLVTVRVAQSQPNAADAHIAWLRAHLVDPTDTVDARVGESLIGAYVQLNREDEAVQTALRVVAAHPGNPRGWQTLLSYDRPANPSSVVLRLMGEALSRLPATDPFRGTLFIQRSFIVRSGDPVAFLRNIFEAVLAGADETLVHNYLRVNRELLSASVRDEALALLVLSDEDRARVCQVFDQSLGDESDTASILADNLTRILDACRGAEAVPLLLDYPFREPNHLQLVDAIASSTGVDRIRVRQQFEELLQDAQREDLFVYEDMHCNDVGYEVMAGVVAAELLKR